MADEKQDDSVLPNDNDYQAPKIEEVVSREGLEREVAYAGVVGPSQDSN